MTTKRCCDRSVFARSLEALLDMMCRGRKGLISLASQHAEEMGLDALGVFDEPPEGAPVLRFPLDSQMQIQWDEVDTQLASLGKLTGLYAVPSCLYLGLRGEDGDMLVRLTDIQQRRLHGVLEYLKDTPIIPAWFKVGAKVQFRGEGPVAEVLSIDSTHKSWVASEDGDQRAYPLNEVAEHWRPV